MKIFAITGGIGCGKSTVSYLLRDRGIPIVDADKLAARALIECSKKVRAIIPQAYPNGELDKSILAKIVFSNPGDMKTVSDILHPRVHQLAADEFSTLSGYNIIGYDIPLLFEANQQHLYSPIIVVASTLENQIKRVGLRSGLTEDQVMARINCQMPLEEKIKKADIVINNNLDLDDLKEQVNNLFNLLNK